MLGIAASFLPLILASIRDRDNPIGNIVQGHTNLTGIKNAVELLWRNGVRPEQVVLGYGFHGRSFELSDPTCSTPGCRFSGGARPGPCSATSGILMYYEIKAILEQIPNLKPIHDQEAAVKYLVFDENQWVSYDDSETFKQKLDWANEIGIGGSMIWASDTDDDDYTAMSGLLGREVAHPEVSLEANVKTPIASAQNLVGLSGQQCDLKTQCIPENDPGCESGWLEVGWDRGGCGVVSLTEIRD